MGCSAEQRAAVAVAVAVILAEERGKRLDQLVLLFAAPAPRPGGRCAAEVEAVPWVSVRPFHDVRA